MGIKIGDVSITPIIEIDYPVPASFLLPDRHARETSHRTWTGLSRTS